MIKYLKILTISSVLITFNHSCRKDTLPHYESSKFVGKYLVTITANKSGQYCQTPANLPTRTEIIIVDYGNTDSTINVFGKETYLNMEGNDPKSTLKIWDDTFSFGYSDGPLGCKIYYTYKGERFDTSPY